MEMSAKSSSCKKNKYRCLNLNTTSATTLQITSEAVSNASLHPSHPECQAAPGYTVVLLYTSALLAAPSLFLAGFCPSRIIPQLS